MQRLERDTDSASRAARPSARYSWAVVGMLWFICFFNYADRQAIFSIFPVLEQEFGFSKEELGLIGSAFAIVYALSAPLAGQIGDRTSRKLVILGGLYVWSLVTGFTALCSKAWQFVLVRGAEGLGETVYFPASMSLISDYHSKRTRSRAMSFHQTSVYAGTIGGGAFAGWMGQHYGWQAPFIFLGVAGIVLGLVLAAFIREPQRDEAERRESGRSVEAPPDAHIPIGQFLGEMLRTPSALLLALAFLGANSVGLIFLSWMPTFLYEKFELSLTLSGVSATVYLQVASMVGSMLGGAMADWFRAKNRGGRMYVQALGALCGAPFIFLCGTTLELGVLVAAMIFFGLSKGIYDSNIWASLYDVVPPSRRGTAVGLMNMIGWMGGALGAYLVGRAVTMGATMSAAIASTAVIYVGVAAILVVAGLLAPRAPIGSAD
ncbi:MAG TPA: MFS transporter [Pirellulales bacterium]|jgi:MFS family permease|nr:MFS transporter [Pirellulales bacterium]